jgi:DNA-directed RNA polymerase I, II, and III subunit RPABC1
MFCTEKLMVYIHTPSSYNKQGYVVSQQEIDTPLNEFRDFVTRGHASVDRNNLHFYATHSQDDSQLIFVYFSDEKNVGVTTMRKFLQQLEDKNIGRGIIIYQEKMTSSAHKVGVSFPLSLEWGAIRSGDQLTDFSFNGILDQVIDAMRMQFELEDFHEVSLLVNITQHHLVPSHRVLTDSEKKALLQR